ITSSSLLAVNSPETSRPDNSRAMYWNSGMMKEHGIVDDKRPEVQSALRRLTFCGLTTACSAAAALRVDSMATRKPRGTTDAHARLDDGRRRDLPRFSHR